MNEHSDANFPSAVDCRMVENEGPPLRFCCFIQCIQSKFIPNHIPNRYEYCVAFMIQFCLVLRPLWTSFWKGADNFRAQLAAVSKRRGPFGASKTNKIYGRNGISLQRSMSLRKPAYHLFIIIQS